jgi:hypothetical protein
LFKNLTEIIKRRNGMQCYGIVERNSTIGTMSICQLDGKKFFLHLTFAEKKLSEGSDNLTKN